MFVLREARRLGTLLTCTILASFDPINPPAWCDVVVAKNPPRARRRHAAPFRKCVSKRQLVAVKASTKTGDFMKAGEDKTARYVSRLPGSSRVSRRGHAVASRFSPEGISEAGIVWKWRLLAVAASWNHGRWEFLHKLVWPRQSVVSQPWQWRTLAVRAVRREMQPH